MSFSKIAVLCTLAASAFGANTQWVEGFDKVEFHHNANRNANEPRFSWNGPRLYDCRLVGSRADQEELVSWKTAVVPAEEPTTFAFVGASCILPSEFSRGPSAKLTVNGHYALTFTLGFNRDFTWKEGDYELKYISKRVEFPYFGSHRQFELNGNSGIYQLSVPADAVKAANRRYCRWKCCRSPDGTTAGSW